VHFLWQGTLIAILYVALRAVLGRSLSAQGRYVLACLTLGAMTAAPPLTFLLIRVADGSAVPVSWSISAAGWQTLLASVVAAWLLGVVGFSIRLAAGWWFTVRLRASSHPAPPEWQQILQRTATSVGALRPVRLVVSSLAEVPMVIGWLRPIILVPVGALAGLPLEHMTALLAHELAHIRRQDYLASILQSVAESLLFYHPAVWWVSQQIRTERELCCDDLAVAACGDVVTYARALAELESQRPTHLSPALAANGGSLVNRVRRLIEPSRPSRNNLPGQGAAWVISLLWVVCVGVATAHAAHVPTPHVNDSRPMVLQPALPSRLPAQASPVVKALLYDPLLPWLQTPANITAKAPEEKKKIRVEGRVISQAGAVPRATVQLFDGKPIFSNVLYAQTTDESGAFVFDDIEPGRYVLKATKAGFLTGGFGPSSPGSTPSVFALEAGQAMTGVVIRLTSQSVIAGHVTNQDGDPVPDASVTAYRQVYIYGRKSIQSAGESKVTDDEGMFRIIGLAPGRYFVEVVPPTGRVALRATVRPPADVGTIYPSAFDVATATPVEVTLGAVLSQIDIRLRRERLYTVKGKVTLNGSPIRAVLTVVPAGANLRGRAQPLQSVAEQGVFEVQNVPAGKYVVTARSVPRVGTVVPNSASPVAPGQTNSSPSAMAEITVDGSDLEGLTLPLEPGIEVVGTFRAEEGSIEELAKSVTPTLASDARELAMIIRASNFAGLGFNSSNLDKPDFRPLFILRPDNGSWETYASVMKDDGTFRVSGAPFMPGMYSWELWNLPESIYVNSVRCDSVDVTRSRVNIVNGSKLEIVLSDKAGSIAGTLRNEKGEPLGGVTVTAWPRGFGPGSPLSSVKSQSSGGDGSFRLAGLEPGDYYVAAWEGEDIYSGVITIPDFLSSFTGDAEKVTLDEGARPQAQVKLISKEKIAAAVAKLP
jgi:beta-lactamase regulating signal transducer with metallopeptidase domain